MFTHDMQRINYTVPQTGTTNTAHAQTLTHTIYCTVHAYNNIETQLT